MKASVPCVKGSDPIGMRDLSQTWDIKERNTAQATPWPALAPAKSQSPTRHRSHEMSWLGIFTSLTWHFSCILWLVHALATALAARDACHVTKFWALSILFHFDFISWISLHISEWAPAAYANHTFRCFPPALSASPQADRVYLRSLPSWLLPPA